MSSTDALHEDSKPQWIRKMVDRLHRAWRFITLHPLQMVMIGVLLLTISGQIVSSINQSRANDVVVDRLGTLPKVSLQQLQSGINDGTFSKIIRHTVREGTFLSPEPRAYIEVVSKQGSRVLEEEGPVSTEIWKGLVAQAFLKPLVFETGFQSDREDRVASVLRIVAIMCFIILVMLMAQMIVGEVLSGHSFKVQKPDRTIVLDDIIGYDPVKQGLREVIDQMHHASEYASQGIKAPKGILLTGDPGVGKTMMAKALANELGADFFFATGADFVEMYVGVGPKRVRSLFKRARSSRLALIFIDEIDALGSRDDTGSDSERRGTLNAMLSEMDGMEMNGRLLVIGATNHLHRLDPALRRPGRFDRIVNIPLPDPITREGILRKYLGNSDVHEDVDLRTLSLRAQGYSGAQLANLVQEAKNLASREQGGRGQPFQIRLSHMHQAQEIVLLGEMGQAASGKELERVAFHELGHALAGFLRCKDTHVEKVDVRGRGRALGYALSHPIDESLLTTESEFRSQLVLLLGGRAAEQVLLGDVSNGAADDIQRANDLARKMVMEFGMGPTTGLIARVRADEVMTEQQAEDVRALLDEAYAAAMELVRTHEQWFRHQALGLQEHGMLGHDALFAELKGEEPVKSTQPPSVASPIDGGA